MEIWLKSIFCKSTGTASLKNLQWENIKCSPLVFFFQKIAQWRGLFSGDFCLRKNEVKFHEFKEGFSLLLNRPCFVHMVERLHML